MKVFKTLGLLLFFLLALSVDIHAVSLSPEVVEKLREEGRLEEWVAQWQSAAERGMYDVTPDTPIRPGWKKFGDVDTLKPLVVCVDFSDNVHTYNTGAFDTLLFSKGFIVPTGSFRDYHWEVSYGQHDPVGGVYALWVRAPQTYDYYSAGQRGLGPYPNNAQKLVEDVLAAIDPFVNFQNYDYDNNDWIDGLIVVHAGPGAEQTGDYWDIWSHRWSITQQIRDGVRISSYTMQPEMYITGALITIGVFCHEWGHFLGLNWEEYDNDYTSEGLGKWTVMAGGSYNNGGKTPAHHSAHCKFHLGWSNVTQLASNQTNVALPQAETSPISYRLYTSGMGGSLYFMVENKQKVGFDKYLPGDGLLIYQVDTGKPQNNQEWCPGSPAANHFKNAIEQADGFFQLEGCYGHGLNQGDVGDPFPGSSNKQAFDDTTMPSSRNYYEASTQVAVWNISDSDSDMYANLDVNWSRPCLVLTDTTFDDLLGGDGDGRPEGGETVRLYFTMLNKWLAISNTTVTGSADTAGITFTDNSSYLGTIGTGGSANNNSDPMEFVVDSSFPGRPTIFTLHVQGNTASGPYTLDINIEVWAGNAQILLVNDAGNYQSYYTSALDSLRQIYDIWNAYSKGDPTFSFRKYNYLIWYTGNHRTSMFSQAQAESLMVFLDDGGGLFLTSQDAAEVLSGSVEPWDQTLLTDYLHVGFGGNTIYSLVQGKAGDEIGDTLWIKPWGFPGADNQTSKDNLLPDSECDTALVYDDLWWVPTNEVAGTKFQHDYSKVVLFGFGFEALSSGTYQGHLLSSPQFVLGRVLDWLKTRPSIQVLSPDGGEKWVIGFPYDIEWQAISLRDRDSVKIQYSTNGGTDWVDIDSVSANQGLYSWSIPEALTPSNSCLVRVSELENEIPSDVSNSYFSIIAPVCGDCTMDGVVDVADVICKINYLFKGIPFFCPSEMIDHNGDMVVDVADVIAEINSLFKGIPLFCPLLK